MSDPIAGVRALRTMIIQHPALRAAAVEMVNGQENLLWMVIAAAQMVVTNMTCRDAPEGVARMYQHALTVAIADNLLFVGIDPPVFYGRLGEFLGRIDAETKAAIQQEAKT